METSGSPSLQLSSGQMPLTDKACPHGEHLGHEDDIVAEAQGYGRKWTSGSRPGALSRNRHGDGRGDTSVDKTMYMKSDINATAFHLFHVYLSYFYFQCSARLVVVHSAGLDPKSSQASLYDGWNRSSLCLPLCTFAMVPRYIIECPLLSHPIADITWVAQASPAQHCRLSDSRARNLSSSTRAFCCKRAPPPSKTPSTTIRLLPLQLIPSSRRRQQPTLALTETPQFPTYRSIPGPPPDKSKCSAQQPSCDPPPPPPCAGPLPPPAAASPRSSRDLPSPPGLLPPPPSPASPAGTRCGATLLAPACPRRMSRGGSPACWLALTRCVCYFREMTLSRVEGVLESGAAFDLICRDGDGLAAVVPPRAVPRMAEGEELAGLIRPHWTRVCFGQSANNLFLRRSTTLATYVTPNRRRVVLIEAPSCRKVCD